MDTAALTALVPNLTAEQVTTLHDATRPVSLAAGERLLGEGEHSDRLFVLTSGTLQATRTDGETVLELGDISPGRWIGVLSVLDPGPTTASVHATEPAALRMLSADTLRRLRDDEPALAGKLLRALSVEVATLLRRKGSAVLTRVGDRVTVGEAAPERSWFQGILAMFGGGA